jgi:hypothetical protein
VLIDCSSGAGSFAWGGAHALQALKLLEQQLLTQTSFWQVEHQRLGERGVQPHRSHRSFMKDDLLICSAFQRQSKVDDATLWTV